jgi:hypothetical protein
LHLHLQRMTKICWKCAFFLADTVFLMIFSSTVKYIRTFKNAPYMTLPIVFRFNARTFLPTSQVNPGFIPPHLL